MKPRFKIDFLDSYQPYGLFHARGRLWTTWDRVASFKTRQEVLDFYEQVKDLPEYLP